LNLAEMTTYHGEAMGKRQRLLIASLVALVAAFAVILHPVGTKLLDIPQDLHSVEVVGVSGSSNHCVVISKCQTVLTAGTRVDLAHSSQLVVLVGFAFVVLVTAAPSIKRPDLAVASPPPRLASL
jgi:hypothetical protein